MTSSSMPVPLDRHRLYDAGGRWLAGKRFAVQSALTNVVQYREGRHLPRHFGRSLERRCAPDGLKINVLAQHLDALNFPDELKSAL